MVDAGCDIALLNEIALTNGAQRRNRVLPKKYYTVKKSDSSDVGRTAKTFMPIYQAAQAPLWEEKPQSHKSSQ